MRLNHQVWARTALCVIVALTLVIVPRVEAVTIEKAGPVPSFVFMSRTQVPVRIVQITLAPGGLLSGAEIEIENRSGAVIETVVFQTRWPGLVEADGLSRLAPLGFIRGRPQQWGEKALPLPMEPGERRKIQFASGVARALDEDVASSGSTIAGSCEILLSSVEGPDFKWTVNDDRPPTAAPDSPEACLPRTPAEIPTRIADDSRVRPKLKSIGDRRL